MTGQQGSQSGQPDRLGLWLALALMLAACLPVLVAAYPQMGDYPAHLARFRVMLDGGGDPFLARYYDFKWQWTGNLGADLLVWPLAGMFGLEAAGRIIAGLIPLLTGLGIIAVAWVLQGRIGAGALLAFAFIWSPSLLLGFLNFSLSLALALLAFALWVKLEGRSWRGAIFLPLGVIVWLCHVAGWGILGILVFGYEWHRSKGLRAFIAPWPLFLPLAPMLAGAGSNALISWGDDVLTYKIGIWLKAMRDRLFQIDVLSIALIIGVLLIAARRRAFDGRLGWAALILIVLTAVMPRHIYGGDYADYRLVAAGLMIACLAVDTSTARNLPRWTMWAAALFVAIRLAVTVQGWHTDSRQTGELLTALEQLPLGARVATAVPVRRGEWRIGRFEHIGGYAVVRRSALENSNFALKDIHMLSLRESGADFADPSHRILYSQGDRIDLSQFGPASKADYLWYVGDIEPFALPAGATIIHRTDHAFLARLAKAESPR